MDANNIKEIFSNFALAWGGMFAEKWKGVDADQMADFWLQKLKRYEGREQVVIAAIDECTETMKFPPSLPEFMEVCNEHSQRIARTEPRVLPHNVMALPDMRSEKDRSPLTKEQKMEMIAMAIDLRPKAFPK